ncbi:MAG: serine/threonine-protein kinase [Woeseiaceae bacterium]|nr:serine/threonine-protein kinase [Woeseiaceae bacterium]
MPDNDAARWARINALFDRALQIPAVGRDRFLVAECAGDSDLLDEIRALLAAADEENTGLRQALGDAAARVTDTQDADFLQQRIGNYRLVELLGTGGMGNVYLGKRDDDQFEHEVAIKLVHAGAGNSHFVERFKAERQVLASLDHPNIARLLDGGETDDGLPYLVMEFVRGEPIDSYCDDHRLGIHERLRLFQKICLAVDYAHRNLVVHRDVKPSNILVTPDGIPKLLDFGIAKVLAESGGGPALTMDGQRMMTPEYASPEQVRGEPVSTATDVYSLGVLLYRLLCGRGPYRVKSDLPSSLARAILEDSPSKPSTVVITRDDPENVADDIGERRGSTLPRLQRRLKGDLDNIALMALRKEPERRYSSARALQQDIADYLSNKPISARADTFAYLAGKFVQRHRIGVATSVAIIVFSVFAVAQIVTQRDRAEAQAATAERVSDFLVSMLESSNPYERSDAVTARELLDRGARQIDAELADEPVVGARLRTTMAKAYSSLGLQNTAGELALKAIETLSTLSESDVALDLALAHTTLADIEYEKQNYESARQRYETSLRQFSLVPGDRGAGASLARVGLSRTLLRLDESEAMLETAQQAAAKLRALLGDDHADTNNAIANLSVLYNEIGDYPRALEYGQQVLQWTEATYGPDDLLVATPLRVLGRITWNQGNYRGANAVYERELGILESSLGPNHPALHSVLVSLASNQRKLGYEANAKAYYERAIQVLEDSESPPRGKLADTYGSLGTLIMDAGYLDEAEPLIRRALELNQQVHGVGNADNAFRLLHLGILYRKRGAHDDARNYLQQAVDATLNRYPDTHRDVQIMRLHLGVNESEAGNHQLALEILENVLASLEAHQGPGHPLVGQTLLELAAVDLAVDEFQRADARVIRSLEIYRTLRDKWHPDIELALRVRADAQRGLGNAALADELIAEAAELRAGRQKVSEDEAKESQQAKF